MFLHTESNMCNGEIKSVSFNQIFISTLEEAAAFITTIREPVVSEEFCKTRQNPLSLMGGGFCTGYIQSYGADCFVSILNYGKCELTLIHLVVE